MTDRANLTDQSSLPENAEQFAAVRNADLPPGVSALTYAALGQICYDRTLKEAENRNPDNKNNKIQAANARSSLWAFVDGSEGLTRASLVGDELLTDAGFAERLRRLESEASNPKTYRNRKSALNKTRGYAAEELLVRKESFGSETLAERLDRVMTELGITNADLARQVSTETNSVRTNQILAWRSGKRTPSWQKSMDTVSTIETALGLPPEALSCCLPKNAVRSSSKKIAGKSAAQRRRLSGHLPNDFEMRGPEEQGKIIEWVENNILGTPKVLLGGLEISYEPYRLHDPRMAGGGRLTPAPQQLLDELDELVDFKTRDFTPPGMERGEKWGAETKERSLVSFLSFFGALREMGFPASSMSLSVLLVPGLFDMWLEWFRTRRGDYTRTCEITLQDVLALVHPKTGFVAQKPGYGLPLSEVPGFISSKDVDRLNTWDEACVFAHRTYSKRRAELKKLVKPGRDPFLAILPVLDSDRPMRTYLTIVDEARQRRSDRSYPTVWATELRGELMFLFGVATGFRQKNHRQMLFATKEEDWLSESELKAQKRMQLCWTESMPRTKKPGWIVRAPEEAFKNAFKGSAVKGFQTIAVKDIKSLYQLLDLYLSEARPILVGGREDSGEVFVSNPGTRTSSLSMHQNAYYAAFRTFVVTYGIYNPYTDQGAIIGLRPHGPHQGNRDVAATDLVKRHPGFGVALAARFLFDHENTVGNHYARFLPEDAHDQASDYLFDFI